MPTEYSIYQVRFFQEPPVLPRMREVPYRLHPGPSRTYFISETSCRNLHKAEIPFKILKKMTPEEAGVGLRIPFDAVLYDLPPENVRAEVAAFTLSQSNDGKPSSIVYCGRSQEEIPGTFVLDIPGGKRTYRWRFEKEKERSLSVQERFPRLIRKMKDPEIRFVVSLGAGGLRFFAHSSLLKLLEAFGTDNEIDEIWGCSGGAVAGLLYTLGAKHGEMEKLGYDIYNQRYNLRLSPSKLDVLKNIVMDWLFPIQASNFKGFMDVQQTLREGIFRIAKKKHPSIPFYAIAYNVSLKRNEVLTPMPVMEKHYNGFIRHSTAMDAILASSAIPILFLPRVILHNKIPYTYVDGSVSEEVPLLSIYNKWVLDRKARLTKKKKLFIMAVNLFPHVSSWKPLGHFLLKHLPIVQYISVAAKLADFIRQSRIDEQIGVLKRDRNVFVAELSLPLQGFSILDPRAIPSVIEKAHGTFLNQLMRIEDSL
jgi:hypothetical protein